MTAVSRQIGSVRIALAPLGRKWARARAGMHRMSAGLHRPSRVKIPKRMTGASLIGLKPSTLAKTKVDVSNHVVLRRGAPSCHAR